MSLDGHRSDWLFNVTTVSITILFLIMARSLWISWGTCDTPARNPTLGTALAGHLMLTAVISAIIFFGVDGTLLYNSFATSAAAFYKFPTKSENPVVIEVYAQQWAWNFRYAGADGKFNTADDIVTLNDLRVPTGVPVHVRMKSCDVIHSFYLPNFRTKQDAVPGAITQLWFQAKPEAATKWDDGKKAQVPAGGVRFAISCAGSSPSRRRWLRSPSTRRRTTGSSPPRVATTTIRPMSRRIGAGTGRSDR